MILKDDLGNFIKISIIKREKTNSNDYWDGNWIIAQIEIVVPGFRGNYETHLRIDDLKMFYDNLVRLQKLDVTKIEFTTIEDGLYLSCTTSRRGSVTCNGRATNYDSSLSFTIETDLPSMLRLQKDLKATLDRYPLVGDLKNNL